MECPTSCLFDLNGPDLAQTHLQCDSACLLTIAHPRNRLIRVLPRWLDLRCDVMDRICAVKFAQQCRVGGGDLRGYLSSANIFRRVGGRRPARWRRLNQSCFLLLFASSVFWESGEFVPIMLSLSYCLLEVLCAKLWSVEFLSLSSVVDY